jgi:DNA-directed RNA polymerase
MTSVYGVTFVGARKQIQARLEDLMEPGQPLSHITDENFSTIASFYLARVTIEELNSMFKEARDIMKWLGECAYQIAVHGQPMAWLTPLGLPVIQPYRRKGKDIVGTKRQSVSLVSSSDLRPVSAGRQRSAFPPNYVHSLDSTHMVGRKSLYIHLH